jgi:hypothetical protein
MTVQEILDLAERRAYDPHAIQGENAIVPLNDAKRLAASGSLLYAKRRALRSLGFSVGVFHEDYRAVERAVRGEA